MPSKYSKEQHLKMNQAAWEEGHRHLVEKRRKTPNWGDDFRNGQVNFTDTEVELLGDLSDLEVLQLSCGGDATQAFWLKNMGATVTACDFSPVAIADAMGHATRLGLDVHFVLDDSQRLSTIKDGQFDLVHVDGNLWYYEDLMTACRNWYRVLRPGGRLFLHEGHPLTGRCLEEDKTNGTLKVRHTYGDKTPEYYQFGTGGFDTGLEAVEFSHTMADILNAIMQAGFVLEKMVECNAPENGFVSDKFVINAEKLPLDFYVIARKP